MSQRILAVLMLCLCSIMVSLRPAFAQGRPEVSRNEYKRKLIVGVMDAPPFSMQELDGSWSGLTVDLWKEIATAIDVEYEFKKVDLKTLLSDLEDGTIDVGATGLSITAAREAKFDFSTPYFVANEAVAVNADQQPTLLQVFRNAFLNWSLLALFLVIIVVMVAGAGLLWMFERRGNGEHYGGKTGKAFGRSLFWSTMVLSGRELPKSIGWNSESPETFAGRIFGMIWMMVGVMLISLFTASAASVMTSKQLQGLVADPNDLRHIKVGTVATSVGEEYLKHEHINYTAFSPGPSELLKGLTEHTIDAAVYNGPIMGYYARTAFNNKISVLRFSLRQDFMAIPVRPGSVLRKPINRALLKVVETKRWQTIMSTYLGSD